jgi:hypothetical protein
VTVPYRAPYTATFVTVPAGIVWHAAASSIVVEVTAQYAVVSFDVAGVFAGVDGVCSAAYLSTPDSTHGRYTVSFGGGQGDCVLSVVAGKLSTLYWGPSVLNAASAAQTQVYHVSPAVTITMQVCGVVWCGVCA